MRITRFQHATQLIEVEGSRLVIDPGTFTTFDTVPTGVVAVVITHEHADHWSPDLVRSLIEVNPHAVCFGTGVVAESAPDLDITVATPGTSVDIDAFGLRFFGGLHAIVHRSIPQIANVGVWVNETLFYGGDALEPPGVPVDVLAVPASGPWLKIGEVMDYVAEVAPNRTFAVHDMLNSDTGNHMANSRIESAVLGVGGDHVHLRPTQSFDHSIRR